MKLTKKLLKEYKKGGKKKKGKIISRYCKLTGIGRNTASKRFLRKIKKPNPVILKTKERKRGPKKVYGPLCKKIVEKCWYLSNCVCAEKLHPMLNVYIDQLKQNNKLNSKAVGLKIKLVKNMSLGTLKNIVSQFPKIGSKKHKGNSKIFKQVPIIANFGKYAKARPGYIEVDFVEHNGGLSSGRFAITGAFVDLFSQWTARGAGWGKNQASMTNIDKIIHQKVYHKIKHYHPDNSKPLLNVLLERTQTGKQKTKLSRSRPYKKNDNAHVEQKNGDKIRKLVGYLRYDNQKEVDLLNKLYQKADLLDNFFIASAKLKKKMRNNKGMVIKRVHDKPKTPFQRLMENKYVLKKTKQKLKKIYQSLNMVKLRKDMEITLNRLYELQNQKSKREKR
jgi:hypothetical protein